MEKLTEWFFGEYKAERCYSIATGKFRERFGVYRGKHIQIISAVEEGLNTAAAIKNALQVVRPRLLHRCTLYGIMKYGSGSTQFMKADDPEKSFVTNSLGVGDALKTVYNNAVAKERWPQFDAPNLFKTVSQAFDPLNSITFLTKHGR